MRGRKGIGVLVVALMVAFGAAGCVSTTGGKGVAPARSNLPGAPTPDWYPAVLNVALVEKGPGEWWLEGRVRYNCSPLCKYLQGGLNKDYRAFIERYHKAGVMIEAGYLKRTGDPRFIEGTFRWRVPAEFITEESDGTLHVELFQVCPYSICAVRVPGEVVESSTVGYVPAKDPSVLIFRKGNPMGFNFKPTAEHKTGIVDWDLVEKL